MPALTRTTGQSSCCNVNPARGVHVESFACLNPRIDLLSELSRIVVKQRDSERAITRSSSDRAEAVNYDLLQLTSWIVECRKFPSASRQPSPVDQQLHSCALAPIDP